jgi:hypothetical protein
MAVVSVRRTTLLEQNLFHRSVQPKGRFEISHSWPIGEIPQRAFQSPLVKVQSPRLNASYEVHGVNPK